MPVHVAQQSPRVTFCDLVMRARWQSYDLMDSATRFLVSFLPLAPIIASLR